MYQPCVTDLGAELANWKRVTTKDRIAGGAAAGVFRPQICPIESAKSVHRHAKEKRVAAPRV
jgi:hypothetical protein